MDIIKYYSIALTIFFNKKLIILPHPKYSDFISSEMYTENRYHLSPNSMILKLYKQKYE